MALRSRASAPPEPAARRSRSWPCDSGSVVRAAQVTGLFDLSRHRCRPARYLKGPPQVHRRSVRGQRSWPWHGLLRTGSSMAGHCILRTMRGPGRRGVLPRRDSANEAPHCQAPGPITGRRPVLARAWPTRSEGSRENPADIEGIALDWGEPVPPGGLFTEDGGPSKSRSKRFGEPLPPLPRQSDPATRPGS
jgi:hypothetical protein